MSEDVKSKIQDSITQIRLGGIDNSIHGIQAIIAALNEGAKSCGDAGV